MERVNLLDHLIVAVEDEPLPPGPSGQSCRLKLNDWLELAKQFATSARIEVCSVAELGGRGPSILEAFAPRHAMLSDATFPKRREHELVNQFSRYWPKVERSGVPAIGVIKGVPEKFPVFVRGELGTFAGGGLVRTPLALKRLEQSGRAIIVRPWVKILSAHRRAAVRLELRVQVVAGRAVAVEYLFPPWAMQRPTAGELQAGLDWTESKRSIAAHNAERIAVELKCRWFVADFAETSDGFQLIELNPGWCAGIADKDTARAVHLAILCDIFKIQTSVFT